MTTVAAPMVHDTIPIIKKRSYLKKPQLPYFRLPGFQKIKRNDIVVFSYPTDTASAFHNFHDGKHHLKPIDKKSNYVKRCTGIAGDTLQIIDGYVYINGKQNELPDRAKLQFYYTVDTQGQQLSGTSLKERYHVREGYTSDGKYILNLGDEDAKRLKNNPLVKSITRNIEPSGKYNSRVFPHSPKYAWSNDNFGPIYIPKAGTTVTLDSNSIPFYKRIIETYEGNDLTINGDAIYINGKEENSYTFKQDYYWMMGDNRQNSEDARYWGYVPFDHVVGKPVFIWMSWDGIKNPRWERFFTTVHGSGKPVSYFFYFLGAIGLWIGYGFFKRIKENR